MVKESTNSYVISRSLLDEISSGHLKPGDDLPSEQEIMERFSVSRAVARDVAISLTGMGVVERTKGRRGRIQKIDSSRLGELFPLMLTMGDWDDIRQVFELRIAIETEAASMAARLASDEQIAEIAELAARYGAQQDGRDIESEDINEEALLIMI